MWVHIYNIPLECWNPLVLIYIANAIGRTLHVARATVGCRRISFARICIELNTNDELLKELIVEYDDPISGDNEQISLKVEYQRLPVRCVLNVKVFGIIAPNYKLSNLTK